MKTKFLPVGVRCYKLKKKKSEYGGTGLTSEVSQYGLMILPSLQISVECMNVYLLFYGSVLWEGLEARMHQHQGAHLVLGFDF